MPTSYSRRRRRRQPAIRRAASSCSRSLPGRPRRCRQWRNASRSTSNGSGPRLRSATAPRLDCRASAGDRPREVVFMFPGQGAQYPGMGRRLYAEEKVFRGTVDACCERLQPLLGLDLRALLFAAGADEAAARELERTAITQPALFVVEYALAQLWQAWGVRPHAMIGHSIGEYAAACVAGVMTLDDALAVVAERGRLMEGLPRGAML